MLSADAGLSRAGEKCWKRLWRRWWWQDRRGEGSQKRPRPNASCYERGEEAEEYYCSPWFKARTVAKLEPGPGLLASTWPAPHSTRPGGSIACNTQSTEVTCYRQFLDKGREGVLGERGHLRREAAPRSWCGNNLKYLPNNEKHSPLMHKGDGDTLYLTAV